MRAILRRPQCSKSVRGHGCKFAALQRPVSVDTANAERLKSTKIYAVQAVPGRSDSFKWV